MTASKSKASEYLSLSEQIVNPVTGDRMTILCSTADSNGQYHQILSVITRDLNQSVAA